jgi:hypothetical protein
MIQRARLSDARGSKLAIKIHTYGRERERQRQQANEELTRSNKHTQAAEQQAATSNAKQAHKQDTVHESNIMNICIASIQ